MGSEMFIRDRTPLDSAAELYSIVDSLSWDSFCAGFRHFGYTFEAFREAVIATSVVPSDVYRKSCKNATDLIQLYPSAIDLLEGLHSGSGFPMIVTCGSSTIWRELLDKHGCKEIPVFGGSHADVDAFLIGKNEKGMLANFFKANGHPVIAIGDSETDVPLFKTIKNNIAVSNSTENLKQLAKIITTKKSGEGVLEGLDMIASDLR